MMPALLMRAKRPNSGEWYWTCGIATVENSPSRTPSQLQDAQRLVVERDRARLGEDLGRLVDRQHAHAVAAEQIRQRGADRAEADDQHVGVVSRTPQPRRAVWRHAIGEAMFAHELASLHAVVMTVRLLAEIDRAVVGADRGTDAVAGPQVGGVLAAVADEHPPLGGFAHKVPDDEHRELARRARRAARGRAGSDEVAGVQVVHERRARSAWRPASGSSRRSRRPGASGR